MSSLDIDDGIQARGHVPGRFRELDDYWNESQAVVKPNLHPADNWAAEFNQHGMDHGGPDSWVQSFEQQHGVNGWATEFEQVTSINSYMIETFSFSCLKLLFDCPSQTYVYKLSMSIKDIMRAFILVV